MLFAQIFIIYASFKACRWEVAERNSWNRARRTFWVGRTSHKLLLSWNVEQVWPGQEFLFFIIIIIIAIIIDQIKKDRSFVFYTTRCLKIWASNTFNSQPWQVQAMATQGLFRLAEAGAGAGA